MCQREHEILLYLGILCNLYVRVRDILQNIRGQYPYLWVCFLFLFLFVPMCSCEVMGLLSIYMFVDEKYLNRTLAIDSPF